MKNLLNRIASTATQLICVLALTIFSVNSAYATKTAPPLPIMNSAPAMIKTGVPFLYYMWIPNKSSSSYWSVTSTTNLPNYVTCDRIVSQHRGCSLSANGKTVTCSYADVYDWEELGVTLNCHLAPEAPCDSKVSFVANLNVMKPQPQTNQAVATSTVMCVQKPVCSDGVDNDGDGLTDFPADPGCENPTDPDEKNPKLKIIKNVAATVIAGGQATYSFNVKNIGNDVAKSVFTVDYYLNQAGNAKVNSIFQYVGSSNPGCAFDAVNQSTNCNLGDLAPNQEINYTITYNVPNVAQLCSQVVMNQVDAHVTPVNSKVADWAKVPTTVLCNTPTPTATPTVVNRVQLIEVSIGGCDVRVNYSKQFDTCAHLVTAQGNQILHQQNLFCSPNGPVNVKLSDFIVPPFAPGLTVKLCNGNNYNECSAPIVVSGGGACATPTATPSNTSTATATATFTSTATATFTPTRTATFTATSTATSTSTRTPVPPTATPTSTNTVVAPTATATPKSQCSDGIDNDGDGKIDFPADPGCSGPGDNNEGNQMLDITKKVNETVISGGEAIYTFTVKNIGNLTAYGVKVQDFNIDNVTLNPIDMVFTHVRASIPGCSFVANERSVICPIGDLAPNEERKFTITFAVPSTSTLCGSVIMNQADAYDTPFTQSFTDWAKAATTVVCQTPTPTATQTATIVPATATATSTSTAVPPTATFTPVYVPPTATFTATLTATATATLTSTATATASATNTATVTATATATATPTATKTLPASLLVPVVNCLANNGDGSYTAYFGYKNTTSTTYTISAGSQSLASGTNYFLPGNTVAGQTTSFSGGEVQGAFSVNYSGSELTWNLGAPGTVAASVTAKAGVSKTCLPIDVVAECVDQKSVSAYKARFGYTNNNGFEMKVPVGPYNQFKPSPVDRAQPNSFLAGVINNAVEVDFNGSDLQWSVFTKTATANTLTKECKANKPPVCSAGVGTYALSCQGSMTVAALDGSGSSDPEGKPLTYAWTTSCVDALIDQPSKVSPSIAIPAASSGAARACSVNLVVNDGIKSSSCSQSLTVTSCATDCNNTPGGAAIKDVCGVCGGNGSTCLDCAGVPNGGKVIDKCGVCGGNNACLDCAGIPNGSAKPDKCGVCNGDGKTCNECTDGGDNTGDLGDLDIALKQLERLVQHAGKRLTNSSKAKSDKTLVANTLLEANKLYTAGWIEIWKIPQRTLTCTNTTICSLSDNSTTIASINSSASQLQTLTQRLLRRLKTLRGGKLTQNDVKLSNATDKLVKRMTEVSSSIPRFNSQCS